MADRVTEPKLELRPDYDHLQAVRPSRGGDLYRRLVELRQLLGAIRV